MRQFEFVLQDCCGEISRSFSAALGDVIPPSVFSAIASSLCPLIPYRSDLLDESSMFSFMQWGVAGNPWIELVPAIGFQPAGSFMLVDTYLTPDIYGLPFRAYDVQRHRRRPWRRHSWDDDHRQLFWENCLADMP